jgi:hypothetical protein
MGFVFAAARSFAFAAQTAAIMPCYGVLIDHTDENVPMLFNKSIITSLLPWMVT